LKGTRPEDNAVAELLRSWLDQAGMRVDDLHRRLTPEHFSNERVPSKSTLSDRLAGVGLRQDFVEAVADVCSADAVARSQLLRQVQNARQRAIDLAKSRQSNASPMEAQLLVVQQRSLAVSDKLLRAMERSAQLERERNDANQMVLVLLAMVEKLQRDINSLTRQRDRKHVSTVEAELQHVHERLSRSEQQRATAEAELDRARAERDKADQLAQEAAEQVRQLSDELERLRGEAPEMADQPTPAADAPVPRESMDDSIDDIDLALVKAARHLDDRADRLDQLASELHLDNSLDNPLTSENAVDNSSAGAPNEEAQDGTLTADEVVTEVLRLARESGDGRNFEEVVLRASRELPATQALRAAVSLRDLGIADAASWLILHTAGSAPPAALPALIAELRRQELDAEMYQLLSWVAQHWRATAIVEVLKNLRVDGRDSDAYQLLIAAGRDCPVEEVQGILEQVSERDAEMVIDAACRSRSALHTLASILRTNGSHHADVVDQALQTRDVAALGFTRAGDPRTSTPPEADAGPQAAKVGSRPLVRPFALTGGDGRRPRYALPETTVVLTTASGEQLKGALPEHQRICRLCREPQDVHGIAETLSYPLGVARILVADLLEAGFLVVHPRSAPGGFLSEQSADEQGRTVSALRLLERARLDLLTASPDDNPLDTSRSSLLGVEASVELPAVEHPTTFLVCLGWTIPTDSFEIDAVAIGVGPDGRVPSDEHFVFYNNLQSPDHTIIHAGDVSVTGTDQEVILVTLSALPTDVQRIVFAAAIYDAALRQQTFDQVSGAYIRLVHPGSGEEIARFAFPDTVATESALVWAELYRFNEAWKFRVIGQGYVSGIRGIATDFGVKVAD
jgi:stress response protein SCP2